PTDRFGRNPATVSHDGHAIGDCKYLLEPMTDINDCHAPFAEISRDSKEAFDLQFSERRRDLIKDDNPRSLEEHDPRNGDELPLRHAKVCNSLTRIDVETNLLEDPLDDHILL